MQDDGQVFHITDLLELQCLFDKMYEPRQREVLDGDYQSLISYIMGTVVLPLKTNKGASSHKILMLLETFFSKGITCCRMEWMILII